MSASIVRLSALDHNKLTGMHPVRSVIRERSSQPVGAAPGRDLLEARALVVAGMARSYTDARIDGWRSATQSGVRFGAMDRTSASLAVNPFSAPEGSQPLTL